MTSKNYAILTASRFSVNFLTNHKTGTIHSVYRKTINLSFGEQLLALQAKGSPLSPVSLITELTAKDMDRLRVAPGTPAEVQDSMILIGKDIIFHLDQTHAPDLQLSVPLNPEVLTQLDRRCLHALCSRKAGSFELLFADRVRAGEIPFLSIADLRLSDTQHFLEKQMWIAAAETMRCLIGLGLGLTPGGDDFLCGVFAGLIFCGLKDHPFSQALAEDVAAHLCDTNDISATFLRCALHGQFSLAVNRLPYLESAHEILDIFSEIGHSSGTDTLCGIYFILKNRSLLHYKS